MCILESVNPTSAWHACMCVRITFKSVKKKVCSWRYVCNLRDRTSTHTLSLTLCLSHAWDHTCTHSHTHIHTHILSHTCANLHTYAQKCTHTHTKSHNHPHADTRTHTHTHTYKYTHTFTLKLSHYHVHTFIFPLPLYTCTRAHWNREAHTRFACQKRQDEPVWPGVEARDTHSPSKSRSLPPDPDYEIHW